MITTKSFLEHFTLVKIPFLETYSREYNFTLHVLIDQRTFYRVNVKFVSSC